MQSVKRGALINFASRIATLGAGLAIMFQTARLGPQQQGTFALFTSTEAVVLTLFSGLGIALARRISHHGERPAALVGATVVVSVAFGVIAAATVGAFANFGPAAYAPLWILAIAAPLLLVAPTLSGAWLGRGSMRALACIAVAPPLLVLAGMGGFMALGQPLRIEAVLWSWVVAKVLVAVGVLIAARRLGWLVAPQMESLRREWRFVAAIGVTNLVALLNYRVDLFLVQYFLGTSATGVYSVAVLAAELLWFVSSSVAQAAYAQIGARDAEASSLLVVRVVHWTFLALLVASPLLWAVTRVLLPWLLGEPYAGSIPVLAILLPGVLVFGAGSALSAYFTNFAGRPLIPAGLATLSLLVNFAISCVLIPRIGMTGGAIATSVSYVIAIAAGFWIFMRLSGTTLKTLMTVEWRAMLLPMKLVRETPPTATRAGEQ